MSDVEAGGATVFTQLGVKLWPKKASAIFRDIEKTLLLVIHGKVAL